MVAFERVLHCLACPSTAFLPCDLDPQLLGPQLLLPALFPPQVQLGLQAGSSGEKQAVESKMLPEQLKGRKNWLTSEEWQAWAAVERGLHLFHCLYLGRLGREQKGGKKCFLSL